MEKDQKQSQFQQESSSLSAPDVDFSLQGFSPPNLNLEAGNGFFGENSGSPLQLTKDKTGSSSGSNSGTGIKRGRTYNIDEEGEGKVLKKIKKESSSTRKRPQRKAKKAALKGLRENAKHAFEEPKKSKEPDHDQYLPNGKKVTQKGNHNHFEYSGFQYNDDSKAEFSGSDDSSDEGYTRRIHGKNLSFKNQKEVKGKRGRTHNTLGFVPNSGMNNSHLIGDQMKGSGHHFKNKQQNNGQNLIPTSDQYNKALMGNIESQIKKEVGNKRFDMQVYTYYFDDNDPEQIKEKLEKLENSDVEEVSKEMKDRLGKKKTKRVKEIKYEITVGKGANLKKLKGGLGPDLALGTLDKESKKERAERKEKKEKKGRKIDLTQFDLIQDLQEVDELLDGDPSYRNLNDVGSSGMEVEDETFEADTEEVKKED